MNLNAVIITVPSLMIKERSHYAFHYIHMHVNAEDQKCKLTIQSTNTKHYIPKLKFDFVSHEDAWPQNIDTSRRDLLA